MSFNFFNFGDFCEIILHESFLRWYCIIEKVWINWSFLLAIFVRFGLDSIKKNLNFKTALTLDWKNNERLWW